ncbi:MAG TPA: FAD-dependent oxidoreductase, partial [Candidatus Limnocylindria bacterium]|nr:FAD-dependent oxidoreductase [Candidatus Limnocylindria bacterium]
MHESLLTPDDLALRPGRGVRSPWLREALAAEGDPPPLPGLATDRACDVAIVGGGYTGLWTALQLKARAPELEIVLLEQDICGGGPSGRNGGFVNAWWDELDTLEVLYGAEPALAAAQAVSHSVRSIGGWCTEHGVDAHFRQAGMLVVSTTAPHDDRPLGSVRVAARLGVPEEFVALSPDEVQARCSSPRFRTGALMRDGATVQPALLARGLRRVALERGVVIHEQSRVRPRLTRDGPRSALMV